MCEREREMTAMGKKQEEELEKSLRIKICNRVLLRMTTLNRCQFSVFFFSVSFSLLSCSQRFNSIFFADFVPLSARKNRTKPIRMKERKCDRETRKRKKNQKPKCKKIKSYQPQRMFAGVTKIETTKKNRKGWRNQLFNVHC